MTTEESQKIAVAKEIEVPEWEHISAKRDGSKNDNDEQPRKALRTWVVTKFNAVVPGHRTYFGRSRRTFLLALVVAFLVVLSLTIGLAVGLSRKGSKDLPLPSNAQTFQGDLTYFDPGLGACGEMSGSRDDIVALSEILFDAAGSTSSNGGNSNLNPLCNRMIRAQRYNEAVGEMRSVDLKVVDRCTGCAVDDLDTTEGAFSELAPIASGRVRVTWAWL